MKKNIFYLAGIIILIVGASMILLGNQGKAVSITQTSTNAQIAKMKVVNGEYVIEPNNFKVGQKVRIEADMSQMPGCSRSIVISAFNIKKTLTTSSNFIEFTPDKAGTFNIACSMNMYRGTFTVLNSDNTKASYVEANSQDESSSQTCGGGGCGCGGF